MANGEWPAAQARRLAEGETSNIEHPTSNIEWGGRTGRWMFDVRCSMVDVNFIFIGRPWGQHSGWSRSGGTNAPGRTAAADTACATPPWAATRATAITAPPTRPVAI